MSNFLALQELTAAELNDWLPRFVRKTADETITNNTLQNDNHLFLSVDANKTYELGGLLRYTCASVTPDIQIQFTMPTGCTMNFFGAGGGTNVTGQEGNISLYSPTSATSPVGTVFYGTNNSASFPIGIALRGLVRVGGTAGTLTLQWAQVTTTATDLIMKTDSYMTLTRLA